MTDIISVFSNVHCIDAAGTKAVVIIKEQRIYYVTGGSKGPKMFSEGKGKNETGKLKYSHG